MRLSLLLLALMPIHAADPAALIRANDLTGLKAAAKDPAFLTSKDNRGNSPLLLAAASGSAAAVEILLSRGADANQANSLGITPLIASATEPAKVKLLLAKGADVKAKSQVGQHALVVAAGSPMASESVRMLIAAGAPVNEPGARGTTPLLSAVGNSCAARNAELLLAAGANAAALDGAGISAAHGTVNCPVALVREFINKGANVNAQNTFGGAVRHGPTLLVGITPLMFASAHRDPAMVRMLLESGAKVDLLDARKMSALHYAVSNEEQDPEIVRLLLARGADPKAKDVTGADAITWARRFNRPEILAALGTSPSPAAASVATNGNGPGIPAAVQLLEKSSETFFKEGGCVSCHHSALVSLAGNYAAAADLDLAAQRAFRLTRQLGGIQSTLQQMLPAPGDIDTMLYMLLDARGLNLAPSTETETVARYLVARQQPQGNFTMRGISRSPIEEADIHRTALAIWLLPQYADAALREQLAPRIQLATKWIEAQPAHNLDEAAMKLLALRWGSAPSGQIDKARKQLLTMQSKDGGFAGRPGLTSEPYATGLAIFALRDGGRMPATDAVITRAAAWLKAAQLPDASWYQSSRSPKFQPYFESGFPHGHDQWISASATAWAVIGLSRAAR